MCLAGLFSIGKNVSAQDKIKLSDGLFIVDYGGTYVIEDDVNQRTISLKIIQQRKDERDLQNSEYMYQVVCGSFSKMVTKFALKTAVKEGIKQAGITGGASLAVSFAGDIASWIYDRTCAYWEKKNNEKRDRNNN